MFCSHLAMAHVLVDSGAILLVGNRLALGLHTSRVSRTRPPYPVGSVSALHAPSRGIGGIISIIGIVDIVDIVHFSHALAFQNRRHRHVR